MIFSSVKDLMIESRETVGINTQHKCHNMYPNVDKCHISLYNIKSKFDDIERKAFGDASEVIMKELKEKVKKLRVKKQWAQEDMAREMGVSLSTIQRWESKGGNPTRLARRELKKLFQEAGIPIGD